jgi:asparagine synthase (glutamine-hydrolysing)
MCGIAGAYLATNGSSRPELESLVAAIVQDQIPRGPDHQSLTTSRGQRSTVTLGHSRLSILDLSAANGQPMWDRAHRWCILTNAEIYNYLELRGELVRLGHEFRTTGDTEVALEAFLQWGPAAVERFNGPFAIALYDAQDERLWLFRDRFGVKPLFYHIAGGTLAFASTCRVIASHFGLKPDLAYVARGLRYWVFEDDSSTAPYEGVLALPASHYLEVSRQHCGGLHHRLHRYYDLRERVQSVRETIGTRSESALVDLVADHLRQAVELRLRSDVPVGVSLSGGLDSSVVAALAVRGHGAVTGFVFGHRDAEHSEGPLAEDLCRRLGIHAEYIWPTTEEIIQSCQATLDAQDAPFLGGSVVAQFLIFKRARAAGVKVLLGGQGADEGFMGYRKYFLFHLRNLIARRDLRSLPGYLVGLLRMGAAQIQAGTLAHYWGLRKRYSAQEGLKVCLRLPEPERLDLTFDASLPLWVRQMHDVTRFSLPTLLRYEDRNSMGNGVESRQPYVDHHVLELGLALPEALKIRNGYGKWAIRQAMRGRINDRIVSARFKRGFDTPDADWIEAGWGEALRSELSRRRHVVRDLLAPTAALEDIYSNRQLCHRPGAIEEALTLIWLGDRL